MDTTDPTAAPSPERSPGFARDPDHTITVRPFDGVVTVSFSSAVVAASKKAKVLKEENYPEVFYIPFEDIYFDFLRRSEPRRTALIRVTQPIGRLQRWANPGPT